MCGMALVVVAASAAVSFLVYFAVHRDEYTGEQLEPMPGEEPAFKIPRRPPESDQAGAPRFSDQP
jgi:hypothetical protein